MRKPRHGKGVILDARSGELSRVAKKVSIGEKGVLRDRHRRTGRLQFVSLHNCAIDRVDSKLESQSGGEPGIFS